LPIANCLLPIAYCLLLIAYCELPIAYCLLPIAYCLLPIASAGMKIYVIQEIPVMKENRDPQRGRQSEKEENNNPDLRDASSAQPGINTIGGDTANRVDEEITKTNSGSFGDADDEEYADDDFETGGGD
jgi:hypothetical protein